MAGTDADGPLAPAAGLRPGLVIAGKYRVIAPIARGGMGTIYKATQDPLGRPVAIKVLALSDTQPSRVKRFLQEASVLGKLKHPNTVTVFDFGQLPDTGEFYMVMEFVDGVTVAGLLKQEGPLGVKRALKVAYEVARSLAEAHEQGIVHRDLKPSNIMLTRSGEGEGVKVLDFGLVKVVQDDQELSLAGRVVGSPTYVAPEQVQQLPVDGRTDIYSLGVTLFKMLTGRAPYKAPTVVATYLAHLEQPIPSFADRGAAPMPEVEALVARCLAKSPSDRFATVEQLKAEIVRVAAHTTGDDFEALSTSSHLNTLPGPSLPNGKAPRFDRPTSRSLWPLVLLFLAILGASLGVIGWALWSTAREPVAPAVVPSPLEHTLQKIRVDSVPSGAEVWENGIVVGVTPLELEQQRSAPRTFVLRLDGYHDTPLEGGGTPTLRRLPMRPAPHPSLELLDRR